jgi:putative restriction endonuclease
LLQSLKKYSTFFNKLRVDRSHGLAPHKPILLISILQAYQAGLLAGKRIYISPELLGFFKANWTSLVRTNHNCIFSYPFFYMKSEPFWELVVQPGEESALKKQSTPNSFNRLNSLIQFAEIDMELANLMMDKISNQLLLTDLLDTWFPDTKSNFSTSSLQADLFIDVAYKILNEDAALYKSEVKKLIQEKKEEEVFIRGGVFKREIPKIYRNTCIVSGLRVDSTAVNVSLIDACHIVPFQQSLDDTITNGITLCPNLHRAFDRGLISIDEKFRIQVSKDFEESQSDYSIRKFKGRKILLPDRKEYYPRQDNLAWHRENIFVG